MSSTHVVDVGGLQQRYHVYGQGDTVGVVQPGGPGVHWEIMRMPQLERHLTMVYVDPLGTGESGRLPTHPDGYTRELYATALDRVLDDLGSRRIYLIGHSYGGFVAQYYAASHPGRLAGLVLYESAPATGPEFGAELVEQVGEFARRNEGNPELPGVLAALASVGSITDDDKLTEALRGLLPSYLADHWGRRDEFGPLIAQVRVSYISGRDADGNPDPVDDRALLPTISVPTLVVAGRYDIVCGERWAREIQKLIPLSRLVVLEHSGHLGHVEEPGRFASAVLDFVAAV